MTAALSPPVLSSRLLTRLIDTPDLAPAIRALPPPSFSALVRQVGLEDAGELLALATVEQLVTAFDEDLFINAAPGERETFDSARFAVWLEVLLEGGEAAAAARFADLSEDFVVHALSSLVLVLDDDALRDRMGEGGDDADAVDKALESALSEQIDGYLLVAREHEGWGAVMSLLLALDRDHRAFLVRVLDRCAALSSHLIEDLDELATHLSAAESLAEDVEAEREERRSARGYVEPRAARNFLALAQRPLGARAASAERDPITRAYFRELDRRPIPAVGPRANGPVPAALPGLAGAPEHGEILALPPDPAGATPLIDALRGLEQRDPARFAERIEELSYLANVLIAGAGTSEARFRPAEAMEAALTTVALGAMLESRVSDPTLEEMIEALHGCSADRLFRRAAGALGGEGFLRSRAELPGAYEASREVSRDPRRNRSLDRS